MRTPVLISLGQLPKTEIAGSYGNCMFSFKRNCQAIFQSSYTNLFSSSQVQWSRFSAFSPAFGGGGFYYHHWQVWSKISLDLTSVSLVTNDVETLHVLICHRYILFDEMSHWCLLPSFSNWIKKNSVLKRQTKQNASPSSFQEHLRKYPKKRSHLGWDAFSH